MINATGRTTESIFHTVAQPTEHSNVVIIKRHRDAKHFLGEVRRSFIAFLESVG